MIKLTAALAVLFKKELLPFLINLLSKAVFASTSKLLTPLTPHKYSMHHRHWPINIPTNITMITSAKYKIQAEFITINCKYVFVSPLVIT